MGCYIAAQQPPATEGDEESPEENQPSTTEGDEESSNDGQPPATEGDEKSPEENQPPTTEGDESTNNGQPPATEGDEKKPNEEQPPTTEGDEDIFESPNNNPEAEEVEQVNVEQEFAAEAEHGPEEIPNDGSDAKDDMNDPLGKVLYVDNKEQPLVIDLISSSC